MVEAAADFSDYRSSQYFCKRESEPHSVPESALRLRDPAELPPWAVDLRRMLGALADFEFAAKPRSPLVTLCETGARFGWQELEAVIPPKLLAQVGRKAQGRFKRDLQRILERATRPCLELERASFKLALAVVSGLPPTTTDFGSADRKFLGKKPGERLFSLFRNFPVLLRLWFQLISQWQDQVAELLFRLAADRTALSRAFLRSQPIGPIIDLRCGLSDPHHGGRTVMLLEFAAGSVIYKPRPGDGEWEWFAFLQEMNGLFRPGLRAARVLRKKGYCWMERVEPAPCADQAAARRFYRRMGGMIGVAYLLRAVDCHRDNIIAAGEYPVLVDAEALWHFTHEPVSESPVDRLSRTGFLPGSNRRSLQSRSSALGGARTGQHVVRIGERTVRPADYQREIIEGFCLAWDCVLGTKHRRAAFVRRVQRIRSRTRRCICRTTETYAAIAQATVQPVVVRSAIERDLLIARLCSRRTVPASIVHAEIEALKRLDIPYCVRRNKAWLLTDGGKVPEEIIAALRRALDR